MELNKEYDDFVDSKSKEEYQEIRQRSENYAALWNEIEKECKKEIFNGHSEYAKEKYNRQIGLLKDELGAIRIVHKAPNKL